MSKVYIYGLVDPRTNQIRYIGKTTNRKNRLESHIKNRNSNKEKCDWIDMLLDVGLKPKMKTLEVCNNENWADREKWWIANGYEKGWDLLNKTEGGEPGWVGCTNFFDFMQSHLSKENWEIFNNLTYDQKADIVCKGVAESILGEKEITRQKITIKEPLRRRLIREKYWNKAHELMAYMCRQYAE